MKTDGSAATLAAKTKLQDLANSALGAVQVAMSPIGLTIQSASAYSGLSRSEIYRLLSAGRIRAVKSGRTTIIVRESLSEYVASLPTAKFRAPKEAA